MQNMIKEIPLQYLTPNQFKRWTASIGFSGEEAEEFILNELGDDPTELLDTGNHWGDMSVRNTDMTIGDKTVQLDGAVVNKLALETRRALHKTPAYQEDSEYMMLLSEHWETRMDENILRSEYKVRVLYEHTCPLPLPRPHTPTHTRKHTDRGHTCTRTHAWVPTDLHTHTHTRSTAP